MQIKNIYSKKLIDAEDENYRLILIHALKGYKEQTIYLSICNFMEK